MKAKYLRFSRFIAALSGMLSLPCVAATIHSNVAQPSCLPLERPIVAVLPFGVQDYQKLQLHERVVRDFESSYFPARLIRALNSTSGIAAAYFSPSETPAGDFNVKGAIKKSDGKMTVVSIQLKSGNGRILWTKSFSVNLSSTDFKKAADPAGRLWTEIAASIAATKQRPGDLAKARTLGYAAQELPVTANRTAIANEGAGAERRGLLDPATKRLTSRATLADSQALYQRWQRESTPLIEQRSNEKTSEVMNGIASVLGGVAMGMGAATGNTYATAGGANVVTGATDNMAISQKKIEEIDKTLATTTQSFAWNKGEPLSVHLFGKVYTFTGSLAKQQADLRRVVADHIRQAQS
jgi:hypothetical protein